MSDYIASLLIQQPNDHGRDGPDTMQVSIARAGSSPLDAWQRLCAAVSMLAVLGDKDAPGTLKEVEPK